MDHFLREYAAILSDPAHTAVEATFTIVVDVLFLGLVWPLIRRHFRRALSRQHQVLDREHGVPMHGALEQPCAPAERPYDHERSGL